MSGYNSQRREGLQVVKVSQDPERRYEVDEEALASVLLQPHVRTLPVVIVSVAGAYRGGKSFLLDFFLRYLNASRQSQLSGEWLGKDDEHLEGFDWRGGCDANTKGIHLWPEPVIITVEPTGERVAVLLMDTQGTFDTESDMGDNSTIFALSTLLSSVQIYNLRANIAEDDLQHLQLFTEYGRLANSGEGKAFQTLLFLIRDWMNAFQYPYGYTGGEALMTKRLTPNPNQKRQLREVRDHIHSCFEKLQCFLMPHPGLIVSDEQFRGRLCGQFTVNVFSDIKENFRQSLLELVPSLFDPKNLTPKIINGDKVQAQGLVEFFKQYVEIFNSDDLPEATTIFQATADACMMSVLREARECYDSNMKTNIVDDQNVLTDMVKNWHRAAVIAAINHFQEKKKLGSQDNIADKLADLQKELEARLSLYLWQNDARVRDALLDAKKAYDDAVCSVCKEVPKLCLHVQDLRVLHLDALQTALSVFVCTRPQVPPDLDTERRSLIEGLEKQYQHLCVVNQQNHWTATLEARELYLSRMKEGVNQKNISFDVLWRQHEDVREAAIKHFQSFRNQPTSQTEDAELNQLKQDIDTYFRDFERVNAHNNLWAMQVALYVYNDCVWSAWGPYSCCFHPRALEEMHDDARTLAVTQFLKDRVESEQDDYKDELIEKLQSRYEELKTINVFNNNQAVDQAYAEYTRRMDKHSQPGLSSILLAPFIIKVFKLLPQYHAEAKEVAMRIFQYKRRGRCYHEDEDEFLRTLNTRIDDAFEVYKSPLQAVIRELGLQHLFGQDTDHEKTF